MAALPKKKPSNTYQKARRRQQLRRYMDLNEWALSAKKSKKQRVLKAPSHKVDVLTGTYNGKQVIDFKTRTERKKRQIEKLEKSQQQA
ncbi:MAG: hypothetical protein Fur0024_5420 [Patescibacteria group bacterium]